MLKTETYISSADKRLVSSLRSDWCDYLAEYIRGSDIFMFIASADMAFEDQWLSAERSDAAAEIAESDVGL